MMMEPFRPLHGRRSFYRREQSFSNRPVIAVPLHGLASGFPNGPFQSRFGLLLGCLRTGHVKDFFFHQRPVQVIDAVVQGNLGQGQSHRNPVAGDVIEVIEINAADGQIAKLIQT
jgi:hypothetical protein